MELVIDGSPQAVPLPSNPTIGDLCSQLKSWCGARRRVLVSIALDGKSLDIGPGQSGTPLPAGSLSATTSTPAAFATRMLADLRKHLGGLVREHEEAARLTVSGKYAEALPAFGSCFRGWALLVGGIQELGRLLGADFKTLSCGSGPAEPLILKVADTLTRFQEAFRKQDVVLLGDLAQYELKPQLREWDQILSALGRLVEALA